MIESGDVHAHINERDGMVRFLEDPEKYNNATTSTRMDDHIRQCIQVAGKMQAVHDAVRLSTARCCQLDGMPNLEVVVT